MTTSTDSLLVLLANAVPEAGAEKIALYTMVSAISVALLTGLFQLGKQFLVGRNTPVGNARTVKMVAKQHEAWERWFLLNDIDPRKVKTGYESLEDVRHAVE